MGGHSLRPGREVKGLQPPSTSQLPNPRPRSPPSHQVVIAIEAAPINPSDIGPLFAPSYGGIGRFDGAVLDKDATGRVFLTWA